MSRKVFISIDANDTGKILERFIFDEDLAGLRQFSSYLVSAINDLKEIILNCNGSVYMVGGDNILADVPVEDKEKLLQSIKTICFKKEIVFAVGVGDSAINSYLAIKYAKATKKQLVECKNNTFSEINIKG